MCIGSTHVLRQQGEHVIRSCIQKTCRNKMYDNYPGNYQLPAE